MRSSPPTLGMPESSGPSHDHIPASLLWLRDRDNWHGICNTRERRRIQNRLNQRTLRSRRGRNGNASTENHHAEADVIRRPRLNQSVVLSENTSMPHMNFKDIVDLINILDPQSEDNQKIIRAFEAFVHSVAGTPMTTLLPSLIQFNFTRALMRNAEVLGYTSSQLHDDAISPFFVAGPWPSSMNTTYESLPAGLRPTDIQRSIEHHPWIDLLPLPQMRDGLIRRGEDSYDEGEFCLALSGHGPGRRPGIVVWRDPWDASGWEVTDTFARSWGWAIAGCWDLFRSTNAWREQRGEKPLFPSFPEYDGILTS